MFVLVSPGAPPGWKRCGGVSWHSRILCWSHPQWPSHPHPGTEEDNMHVASHCSEAILTGSEIKKIPSAGLVQFA